LGSPPLPPGTVIDVFDPIEVINLAASAGVDLSVNSWAQELISARSDEYRVGWINYDFVESEERTG
jgi:hypothetical protein